MNRKIISGILTPIFLLMTLAAPAQAGGMITTSDYVKQVDADATRAALVEQLNREDVQAQLLALGVDQADVEARVAAMTDAEVAQLHAEMEDMPAGAGAVGTLAVVLLVLIILDVAGVTNIFPFINAAN
ncbi:MAG: PA2779 family protein [Gammaproteobacteria bacterium]|nr:PA2779 family protein [Gammaproteobacteria bacterium]